MPSKNQQVPKRRAYAMPPTLHCKTHAISLSNISCSSLLSRFHDLKKNALLCSIKVHRLGLPFLALAEAQAVVLLTAAHLQLLPVPTAPLHTRFRSFSLQNALDHSCQLASFQLRCSQAPKLPRGFFEQAAMDLGLLSNQPSSNAQQSFPNQTFF